MIKIGKLFYIHYTTVLFFVICWFTRRLELLFLSYVAALLHELSHTASALLIGIEPSYIAFFPFGVNLRVKSRIIYSVSDEILLYMSGPLVNAVIALFTQMFLSGFPYARFFYWNNIGLFLFNLLPILPMDGGMVLKRILSDKIGSRYAEKILKFISLTLIILLICFEIILTVKSSFNFSLIFAIIFLTANIFTNTEKYSMNFLKELIYIKSKSKKEFVKAEVYLVSENFDERRLAENFNASKSYIVLKKDKNGKVNEILTEENIIDRVLGKRPIFKN